MGEVGCKDIRSQPRELSMGGGVSSARLGSLTEGASWKCAGRWALDMCSSGRLHESSMISY